MVASFMVAEAQIAIACTFSGRVAADPAKPRRIAARWCRRQPPRAGSMCLYVLRSTRGHGQAGGATGLGRHARNMELGGVRTSVSVYVI